MGVDREDFSDAANWQIPQELPDLRRVSIVALDTETRDEGLPLKQSKRPDARAAQEGKRPMIGHVGDDGDIDEAAADAAIGQTEKRASIRRELRQLWSELPKPNRREGDRMSINTGANGHA